MSDPVRCVVFDVDDTLYLERDYVRSGFGAVGEWATVHLGVENLSRLAWEAFEAGARRTIFDDVLLALQIEPNAELIGQMVDIYRRHRPAIELLPDARVCLAALHRRVCLAAITDGPLVSQRAKVEALGLERWMTPVVLTAELGEGFGKPHPGAFRRVERVHSQRGGACVYVADNPRKDFAGPASLGWRTVRVRRPMSLHAELGSGPDVQVEMSDLAELLAVLEIES